MDALHGYRGKIWLLKKLAIIHSYYTLLVIILWSVSMNNKRKITIIAIVPRAAARMFSSIPRYGDISDHMQDILHWLPVRKRILYIRSLQL